MRVLHVLHRPLSEEAGGVQTNLWNLIPELARLGVRSEVLTPRRTGWDPVGSISESLIEDESIDQPFPLHQMQLSGDYQRKFEDQYLDPACRQAFERFLQVRPFDLVHFHHLGGLSFDLPEAARELGVRTVFSLHDYYPLCLRGQMVREDGAICAAPDPERCAECIRPQFKGLRKPSLGGLLRAANPFEGRMLMKAFLERSTGILNAAVGRFIAPSAFARERFIDQGLHGAKIEVIPYGLRLPDSLPPYDCKRTGPLAFGYLGSFLPNKGLATLCEAGVLRAIRHVGGTLELHGGTMEELLDLTEPPPPWVHVHGAFASEKVWEILAGLDVLVVPSVWEETYNIVLREGLATGMPVIASRIGGMKEALDAHPDRAWGFPAGDSAALERAIEQVTEAIRNGRVPSPPPPPHTVAQQAEAVKACYQRVLSGAA